MSCLSRVVLLLFLLSVAVGFLVIFPMLLVLYLALALAFML